MILKKGKNYIIIAPGGLKITFTLDSISASKKDNDTNDISFYRQKSHSILNK